MFITLCKLLGLRKKVEKEVLQGPFKLPLLLLSPYYLYYNNTGTAASTLLSFEGYIRGAQRAVIVLALLNNSFPPVWGFEPPCPRPAYTFCVFTVAALVRI